MTSGEYDVIGLNREEINRILFGNQQGDLPGEVSAREDFFGQYRPGQTSFSEVVNEEKAKKPWFRPDQVVFAAIIVTIFFQQLAGFSAPFGLSAASEPERGDYLKNGSQDFGEVHSLLADAVAQDWVGSAAGRYCAANTTLQELVLQMAELDSDMSGAVNGQADCVAQTQLGIGIEQDLLLAVYGAVWAMECAGMDSAAWIVAFTLSGFALIAAAGLLINCAVTSQSHADTANGIDYGAVAQAARQLIEGYQAVGSPVGTPLRAVHAVTSAPASFRGPTAAPLMPAPRPEAPTVAPSNSWGGAGRPRAEGGLRGAAVSNQVRAAGQPGRAANLPSGIAQPGSGPERQNQRPLPELADESADTDHYGVPSSEVAGTGASAAIAANN